MAHLGYSVRNWPASARLCCNFVVFSLRLEASDRSHGAIVNDRISVERQEHSTARDRVIASIYDTLLRPDLYDSLMDAWAEEMTAALGNLSELRDGHERFAGVALDPILVEHFERATDLLARMRRSAPRAPLSERVGRNNRVSFLLSNDLRILAASPSARQLLGGETDGAELLDHLTAESIGRLRDLLQLSRRSSRVQRLAVLHADCGPKHLLARLVDREEASGILGGAAPALLVEALNIEWHAQLARTLADSFHLSPAEIEVIEGLMAGQNTREIAADRGRSEHTVRNQIKAALARTGTDGQADLVRLVAMIAKATPPAPSGAGGTEGLGRSRLVDLADGRRMELIEVGPETGRPFLFLHGMLDSTAGLARMVGYLHERGLRAVAPLRPGFGGTDVAGPPPEALRRHVDDLCNFCARENLRSVPVVAHMGGAVAAHALAARAPERVSGIVSVAGVVPIVDLRQITGMPRRQRVVALTARFAPGVAPALLRAGIAQIDSDQVDRFLGALYPDGTPDRDVIESLGVARLIHAAYRKSVARGPDGFLMDGYHVVRDWSRTAEAHNRPVHIIHGTLDRVVQVRSVASFSRCDKNRSLVTLPDTGQLVLYKHPHLVLDAIESVT
jgi:pimeloyl-ACP methyl ester carboxylesterase/DNA-binding CsgD family transcriptional regulator